MATRGFHRDVDEVRIIIGPKFHMIVKLDNDPDELIFNEELVEHKSEGSLMKSHCPFKPKIVDSFLTQEVDMTSFLQGKLKE